MAKSGASFEYATPEDVADHLLAEGVIVPSDKPLPLIDEGDRVLCPICWTKNDVKFTEVKEDVKTIDFLDN